MEANAKKDKATKKDITFRIPSSHLRRNVDKHIVRSVLLNHQRLTQEILDLYKVYGLNEQNYRTACDSLRNIKEIERGARVSKKKVIETLEKEGEEKTKVIKRDYGKTINAMLNSLEMQLILRKCLEHSLSSLYNEDQARVKGDNKRIYIQTIEDYLAYISALLPGYSH